MLEFIVLGQVPGTHFVLTFSWVVVFVVLGGGVSFLRHEHKHRELMQRVGIEEVTI